MAKRPLKVFRTSIGFQDAYVATTSRKAALEAWGTDKDLFAAGIAEVVTDEKLGKAALAKPGTIIRVAKGTAAQHLAAAGKGRPSSPRRKAREAPADPAPKKAEKPKRRAPKPSRAKLDRARAAAEASGDKYERALAKLDARIAALGKERDAMRRKRDAELSKLEERKAREEEAYRAALEAWDE